MERGRVLVVDDDPGFRNVVGLILESGGWDVTAAADGPAGLAAARRTDPDVVIVDLAMPGASGIDVARALSALPVLGEVPVIAMTSDRATLRESARSSGLFTRVLTKPVAPATLLRVVSEARPPGP